MEGLEHERRGLFDGLSVPHSLHAILLAGLGLFIYWLGVVGIEESLSSAVPGDGHCRLLAGMLGNATARMSWVGAWLADVGGWRNAAVPYDFLVWVLFLTWTAVVWAFFAGAICRIAAMKLAREESIELREALQFGARKFLPNLLTVVVAFGLAGVLYLVVNATIAGWVGRIPYVGDVLLGVLFFLVLIASFLIVFLVALGLFGSNMAAAAIATEASDTFDGVSRAWNYILARPWQVVLAYAATFVYLSLVIFFGGWFLKVSVKSLTVGDWGLGAGHRVVEVDEELRRELKLPSETHIDIVRVPAKGQYLYGRLVQGRFRPNAKGQIFYPQGLEFAIAKYRAQVGQLPTSLMALIQRPEGVGEDAWAGPYLDQASPPVDRWGREVRYELAPKHPEGYLLYSLGPDGQTGTADDLGIVALEQHLGLQGPLLDVAPALESTLPVAVYGMRFWLAIARLLLYGYVVAYFFGATTTIYFLLRKDVEGDDYTEITLDDEPDEDDAAEFEAAPGEPKRSLPLAKDGGPQA